MSKELMDGAQNPVIFGAIAAMGLWVWRALAVGMRLGELTNEVKSLRRDVEYIRSRIDDD